MTVDAPFMVYIHPPLALAGYISVLLAFVSLVRITRSGSGSKAPATCTDTNGIRLHARRLYTLSLRSAWVFTFFGLVTGMVWGQLAWGSYWSWDPKETATLVLFLGLSVQAMAPPLHPRTERRHRGRPRRALSFHWSLVALNSILVLITILVGLILPGLHSYLTL